LLQNCPNYGRFNLLHFADLQLGLTPLYIASFKGHVGAVKELLAGGADVNKCCATVRPEVWSTP